MVVSIVIFWKMVRKSFVPKRFEQRAKESKRVM